MNNIENKGMLGGWVKDENGFFTTAKPIQDFTTPEYGKFAKAMRARWSLIEYLKIKIPKLFQSRQGK